MAYSDAAMLKGNFAHMAAEFRIGNRKAPSSKDWSKAASENIAEEAAQDVAKHIFSFQQSLDAEKEQMEILANSAFGQMKVLAIVPGESDLIRLDGISVPEELTVSVLVSPTQLELTFIAVPISNPKELNDESLQIGFIIFDELKVRQKARYNDKKKSKRKLKSLGPKKTNKPLKVKATKKASKKTLKKSAPKKV